jgi:hypothetical protein
MLDIEEKNLALLTKNGSTDHGTVLTTMLSIKLRHNNRNLLSLLNTTAAAYELEFLQKAKSVNELKGILLKRQYEITFVIAFHQMQDNRSHG